MYNSAELLGKIRPICAAAVCYFIFVQCNQNDKDGALALFHLDIFAGVSVFVRVSVCVVS